MFSLPNGRRAGLAAVLLATALQGCGPDSRDDGLSATEYRERGNRLCREATELGKGLPQPKTERDLTRLLERTVKESNRFQARFERLEPPDELRADHQRSQREGREAIEVFEDAVKRIHAGEGPQRTVAKLASRLNELVERGNATARRLGLNDCVSARL